MMKIDTEERRMPDGVPANHLYVYVLFQSMSLIMHLSAVWHFPLIPFTCCFGWKKTPATLDPDKISSYRPISNLRFDHFSPKLL